MANKYDDNDRLQLKSLRIPGKTRGIIHGSRPAKCLAWLLMSRTIGDYRAWRRIAGLSGDGGYFREFVRAGILTVKKVPQRNTRKSPTKPN